MRFVILRIEGLLARIKSWRLRKDFGRSERRAYVRYQRWQEPGLSGV